MDVIFLVGPCTSSAKLPTISPLGFCPDTLRDPWTRADRRDYGSLFLSSISRKQHHHLQPGHTSSTMEPPSSSPVCDKTGIPAGQKVIAIASSPIRSTNKTTLLGGQKIKKPPTVTPKRFTKFFTPRNTASSRNNRPSKAGRQLRDITQNGVNRRRGGISLSDDTLEGVENELASSRPFKRRKFSIEVASSPPLQSSPLKHAQTTQTTPLLIFEDEDEDEALSEAETLPEIFEQLKPFPKPIRRLREPGPSRRILERSFGGHDALSRHRRGPDHGANWRAETANFVTKPTDLHTFRGTALPFCTTSCNTNPLIAVGDEEGSVRLIDSNADSHFGRTHVTFRVHKNAVMDIGFSSDDYILATASGDQTARVVDMQTQQTMCQLIGHKSSVKQVRFRPNDDNMVTTSSRDGTVQVWDLRCGGKAPAQSMRVALGRNVDGDGKIETQTRYGQALDVGCGHRSTKRPFDAGERGELSITSFQHMPHGREHLIITASEVDASVKIWDIRGVGRRSPVPLGSTPIPEAHRRTRNYGISSMAMSGDGARLYTVCRDSTIYAYSTNQLALGNVPEMSSNPSRRRTLNEPKAGLAPLYGFRHPTLRVSSFYIKASLRKARDGRGEILAVGNTDCNPVLFPTDERHFPRGGRMPLSYDDEDDEFELPSIAPSTTTAPKLSPYVFEHGTSLVRAHNKEATSLAWSTEGNLISVSDDFTARCWRENAQKARGLRTGGEINGGRWRAGWADVGAAWDEEE